ncbi:hypothetical protein K435DRAFT_794147 [Dendrothele bispora CBS 962.96]|uniref:Uncharacterized protein n=1 Tax=Dendrothele bispora (strain CBS 962.96) TaxID=1314807 RepID=A0A4V4HGY0_DENBC|nr:hypothetical protein K435DRAFT_794147 [Dendrothele bispora CBS 962.96]
MDTTNERYRRITTYSRKQLRRSRAGPVLSDNSGQDSNFCPEPTVSGNSEQNSEENESENDVSDARDELRKPLIKALSCPICYELSMPPCVRDWRSMTCGICAQKVVRKPVVCYAMKESVELLAKSEGLVVSKRLFVCWGSNNTHRWVY